MPWLKPHEKGSLLNLYIQPGASKSEISGKHGELLKIKIKAVAQDGEANEALIEYISLVLRVSKSRIHLLRGETSRQKVVLVELPIEEVKKRLEN